MEADHPYFEQARRAVDAGDVATVRALLADHPELVAARPTHVAEPYAGYFHGATLLHHVAGNPIREPLPDNVVDVARVLLEGGADPDATCGGGPLQPGTGGATTLGLVASGAQAHRLGHTEALIDALLEHGATLDPDGGMWGTIYHTVEHQGQRDVAHMLHRRGVHADLPIAAALGSVELVDSFLGPEGPRPGAVAIWSRTVRGGASLTPGEMLADALLAGAVSGYPAVVDRLLDAGARIDAVRPWGPFPVTPLHGAAWAGWPDVVTLLLERGADATASEPTYHATPRGWAEHCARAEAVAAFERAGVGR